MTKEVLYIDKGNMDFMVDISMIKLLDQLIWSAAKAATMQNEQNT